MTLMHHAGLRVNAPAVDDLDAMAIYAESDWLPGPHPDTDRDDPALIPGVLPAAETTAPTPKTPRSPRPASKD